AGGLADPPGEHRGLRVPGPGTGGGGYVVDAVISRPRNSRTQPAPGDAGYCGQREPRLGGGQWRGALGPSEGNRRRPQADEVDVAVSGAKAPDWPREAPPLPTAQPRRHKQANTPRGNAKLLNT